MDTAASAGPLDPGEREILLRIAWRTLVGVLTDRPIQDRDLQAYVLTPRLTAPRGCFVTLRKANDVRGAQGEIEPTRPLYQQAIVFTRRAARDPRFLPLTDRDLPDTSVEVSVLGERIPVQGPSEIHLDTQGVFLEKWGRRALFLPGQATAKGWGVDRTLDELCRNAALPAGAWKQGAGIAVFTSEVISGAQPPPLPEAPDAAATPTPSPSP